MPAWISEPVLQVTATCVYRCGGANHGSEARVKTLLEEKEDSCMGSTPALPTLRRRALIADDDPAVRTLLTDFLEQQGFEVRTAQDGSSALALFHAESFDLILVDLQMPDLTGLEVAAEIRRTAPHIPIALITGTAGALDPQAVMQAGINRTFPKPFRLEELSAWISSLPL